MPYKVMQQGEQWCVMKEGSDKSMGCHDSQDEAEAQMRAIYANEHKALSEKVEKKTELLAQMNELSRELDALDETPAETIVIEADTNPHNHPDLEEKTLYAAPDSNEPHILKGLIDKFKRGLKPGQTMFKSADGSRLMLIVTSNSYQDREGETLTSEALKADVDRHWTGDDAAFMSNNKLLFWHDDDLPLGDIVWGDTIGPFYVELAQEVPNPIAKSYFNWRETHPDEKWGASHRFKYLKTHRNEDGDYARIYKEETTTLPIEAAANLLTLSEVIPMSDKRAKKFDEIMGLDGAYELVKTEGLSALERKLAEQGIDHKSTDAKPEPTDESAVVRIAKALIDTTEDAGLLDERLEKAVANMDEKSAAFELKAAEFEAKTTALDAAIASVNELAATFQSQLDARPRVASRETANITTDTTVAKEVMESLTESDPVFGSGLKPLPK